MGSSNSHQNLSAFGDPHTLIALVESLAGLELHIVSLRTVTVILRKTKVPSKRVPDNECKKCSEGLVTKGKPG